MKSGFLVYKCRRCGSLKKDIHVPNGGSALVAIINDVPFPKSWGLSYSSFINVCNCDDGNLGISDLIGFEEDK